MALLFLQLGDIHIAEKTDPVLSRVSKIVSAVNSVRQSAHKTCHVIVTGDSVQYGLEKEYDIAAGFFRDLEAELSKRLNLPIQFYAIPGNHDLDLSDDQSARNLIIQSVNTSTRPKSSIESIALSPLQNYFRFAAALAPGRSPDPQSPYSCVVTIKDGDTDVRLQLLNTAWMSVRREKTNSLFFPLEEIDLGDASVPILSIAAMHHPLNWFQQPDAMRQLRECLETTHDLIITGHEHGHAAYEKKSYDDAAPVDYIEGNVLQERTQPDTSSFSVLSIDQIRKTYELFQFKLKNGGHYERIPSSGSRELRQNPRRADRRFSIRREFVDYLEDADLPLADTTRQPVKLTEIFIYPDLREFSDGETGSQPKHIRGEQVVRELIARRRALVAAPSKAGKTSLAKSLFLDLHRRSMVPIFIDPSTLKRGIGKDFRTYLSQLVTIQYEKISLDEYLQEEQSTLVAIVDDVHSFFERPDQRDEFLKFLDDRFGVIIAFADLEFTFEEMHTKDSTVSELLNFDRLQVCEFGFIKVEEFGQRYLSRVFNVKPDGGESEHKNACQLVQKVLKTNAIPHHPWVLIVLFQQTASKSELAAKNGSYGYLFQAIVTNALSLSDFKQVDIQGKYVYLSELAFTLYTKDISTLDDREARDFHGQYLLKYALEISYDVLVSDLQEVGILRVDGGRVSFRTKYSFWFFVANYISKVVHTEEGKALIDELCKSLHHDDSANVFVFLAHLSNHPVIIESVLATARSLFKEYEPANLEKDLSSLNKLRLEEVQLVLPASSPEENRRRGLESKDEDIRSRDASATDGRKVQPRPAKIEDTDDMVAFLSDLRAAVKTLEILGQVLRNNTAMVAENKEEIVVELYLLARRLIKIPLELLSQAQTQWVQALYVKYQEDNKEFNLEQIAARISHHIFGMVLMICHGFIRHVSTSVSHELLGPTFSRVLKKDPQMAAKLFDLSIKLDLASSLPANEAKGIYKEAEGNILVKELVRALIAEHLYLYVVPYGERQSICNALHIEIEDQKAKLYDRERKRLPGEIGQKQSETSTTASRKKKKENRRNRRKNRKRKS